MRKTRKIIALVIILCIAISAIPFKLFATEYGSGAQTVRVGLDNNPNGFVVQSVTVNGNPWLNNNDEYSTDDGQYQIIVTVEEKDGQKPDIYWGGNFNGYVTKTVFEGEGVYTFTLDFDNSVLNENYISLSLELFDEHNQQGGSEEPFDGHAWILWDNNGYIARYHFSDLEGVQHTEYGIDYYPVNYIEVLTLNAIAPFELEKYAEEEEHLWEDESNKASYCWVTQKMIDFMDAQHIAEWQEFVDLLNKTPEELAVLVGEDPYAEGWDEWDFMHSMLLESMGGSLSKNSLSTNANRIFRALIYDASAYEGITFDVRPENYTYFPNFWDPVYIEPTVELSGHNTIDNPAYYETFLLEPSLRFSNSEISKAKIKNVVVADVNQDAATITKSGEEWQIKFNSNYYENVEFRITDENNEDYFLNVHRFIGFTIEEYDTENDMLYLGLDLTYDASNSYEDYDVKAVVTYKDGTIKTINVPAINHTEWSDEVCDFVKAKEFNAGKNLKKAYYAIEADEEMQHVSFTVVKKGALDGVNYGGTFAGTGVGFEFFEDYIEEIVTRWQNGEYTNPY